jgi:hypothetical protein
MNTHIATRIPSARRSIRTRVVLAVGPVTVLAGLVWAVAQPYRVTLLHPRGQGFWWLFVEPPLWAVVAGVLFALFVARGLAEDLEELEL